MKTTLLNEIYAPKNDKDWFLFKVNKNIIFSFRLGGVKREISESINYSDYELIDKTDYVNIDLSKILTDEEWVYMILENGNVIVSGWVSIDRNGESSLGLQFKNISDFEVDFFDYGIREIELFI